MDEAALVDGGGVDDVVGQLREPGEPGLEDVVVGVDPLGQLGQVRPQQVDDRVLVVGVRARARP